MRSDTEHRFIGYSDDAAGLNASATLEERTVVWRQIGPLVQKEAAIVPTEDGEAGIAALKDEPDRTVELQR